MFVGCVGFMVIDCVVTRQKRRNLFITDREVEVLWRESERWSKKFRVMLGFALFRGLRVGEIVAINLYDFKDAEFRNLRVVAQKSYVEDVYPLLEEFSVLLKEYVRLNLHTFTDGFLFPYKVPNGRKHMGVRSAESAFCKLRKIIGLRYPEFLDRWSFESKTGTQYRYRISFHSCRRWFETKLWDKSKDKMQIRDMMRYCDSRPVDVYVDCYETWKNEGAILRNAFGEAFGNSQVFAEGQKRLDAFI